MTRKKRIAKAPEQKLNECETHLYFLWDACRLYPKEPERFKQIAAELRVLVCETRSNKPLLLNLMDEYGFSYDIQPPGKDPSGPPLKPGPVPMVGWREDPVEQNLSEAVAAAIESGDEQAMERVDAEMAALAVPVPFREWVNKGLAVYIRPHDYSNRDLVLAIAQQFGSSHEDDSVEEPILQLQQFVIGGSRGDVAPLIAFARTVIHVGRLFIAQLVADRRYEAAHFRPEAV